jgi:flagellar hook-associated protein 1 FlgK
MSNSILTNIGLKAMAAQFAGLQTTGHNIANASVAGYSRQEVNLATSGSQSRNGTYFGMGVDIGSVTRMHDAYLTGEAGKTASLASMDATRLSQLSGLENLFQPGETGLGDAASQFFKSMSDVSSQPSDLSSRTVALARANDMAMRFRDASNGIDSLQQSVTTEISAAVTQINGLASSLASVNQQLSMVTGASSQPNDLLDQRDQLITQLSKLVHVDRIDNADGGTSVTIAGGQQLVLGTKALALKMVRDPDDPTRSAVAVSAGSKDRIVESGTLAGGSLAGLLQFQNRDLVQGRNLIGRLAASVGMAINAQQSRGVSLQPPLGQVAGSPVFNIGAPVALARAGNATDPVTRQPLGRVTLTVTDPSALQASDYAMRADPAGGWQVTRLSDGVTTTINSGDTLDGLRIDITNAQADDKFLLQPVGRAAGSMQALLTDPRDLAAASPLVATVPAANTGTVSVNSLQVTAAPLPVPGGTVQVTFTDNVGGYNWTLSDASGNGIGGGSGIWQAGQTLPPPGVDFNGFTAQIQGVPRQGDVITVSPTPASGMATNNGNALSMMGLADATLVDGRTATDGYAQAMADIGVRVQSGKTASTISTAVAQQAETARSSQAGVNLDEEAARLIQYQQGYQAAAKVLTVAQTLFDTLLQATGH